MQTFKHLVWQCLEIYQKNPSSFKGLHKATLAFGISKVITNMKNKVTDLHDINEFNRLFREYYNFQSEDKKDESLKTLNKITQKVQDSLAFVQNFLGSEDDYKDDVEEDESYRDDVVYFDDCIGYEVVEVYGG